MLYLLVQVGGQRYAIDARHVHAVLPLIDIRAVTSANQALVGVLDFRGAPVPVVDVSVVVLGRPAARRLSTRIVVTSAPGSGLRGILAEGVTETFRLGAPDAAGEVALNGGASRLTLDAEGVVQHVDLQQWLASVEWHAVAQ